MFDFYYAVTHHLELIQIAQAERASRIAAASQPGLKDHVYFRLGNFMITTGRRLRKASNLGCEIPALQEGGIPDLRQEYS